MRNAKATPKPPPGSVESIRRQTDELRSAAAMLREVGPLIERLEGELGLDDRLVLNRPGRSTVEQIESIHSLTEAAQMATRDIEDRRAVRPMIELLEVIQGRLKSVARQIDDARSSRGTDDPAIALVELHREAWAIYVDIDNRKRRDPALHARADQAAEDALAKLLETPPTTLAGAHAAIAWLVEFDENCIPETSGKYLPTLLRSPIFATEGRAA